MKRRWILAAMLVLAAPTMLVAQGRGMQTGGGWGPASQYARLYQPATVETLRGEVLEVLSMQLPNTPARGVHLRFRTDRETLAIHLGPEWFVNQQDLQLEPGDQLAITGSRITFEGKPALVAALIQKGDQILEFRDEEGFPRWSAARAGPPLGGRGRGWGLDSDYIRLYNPATTQTVTGKVIDLGLHTPRYTVGWGRELTLQTPEETLKVHLGPDWFLRNQDVQIATDDTITVTGSRIPYEGRTILIAAELRRGEETLELRDARGQPRWAASRTMRDRGWGRGGRALGQARGGWGLDSDLVRMYDPDTVRTIEGEVLDVLFTTSPGTVGRGVHLQLRTGDGTLTAHLGPEWYLANQDVGIAPGDRVAITGSLITYEGEEVLIAAKLGLNGDVLELRDPGGFPRWSGWRRGMLRR